MEGQQLNVCGDYDSDQDGVIQMIYIWSLILVFLLVFQMHFYMTW